MVVEYFMLECAHFVNTINCWPERLISPIAHELNRDNFNVAAHTEACKEGNDLFDGLECEYPLVGAEGGM